MIKFEKVTPGSVLLDVRRTKMGNTTMSEWSCWDVRIVSIDHENGTAVVRWNGNPPETWRRSRVQKLFLNPPKGYREQCARGGAWPGLHSRPMEPMRGKLAVIP